MSLSKTGFRHPQLRMKYAPVEENFQYLPPPSWRCSCAQLFGNGFKSNKVEKLLRQIDTILPYYRWLTLQFGLQQSNRPGTGPLDARKRVQETGLACAVGPGDQYYFV